LQREAKAINTRRQEATAEADVSKTGLNKRMQELNDAANKLAKDEANKAEAVKMQLTLERQGVVVHRDAHEKLLDLQEAKRNEHKAASLSMAAKIMHKVASAEADSSGGDDTDLSKSTIKREEFNENLKHSMTTVSAMELEVEKSKHTVNKATAAWQAKEDAVHENVRQLRIADGQFADAKYEIDQAKHEMDDATENQSQAKAEDDNAQKELKIARGLEDSMELKLNNADNADEASMQALLGAPREAEQEAAKMAQDRDGLSSEGNELVAADGVIAADFIKRFSELPLPDNGRNPILEAEARASLADNEQEATMLSQAPELPVLPESESTASPF